MLGKKRRLKKISKLSLSIKISKLIKIIIIMGCSSQRNIEVDDDSKKNTNNDPNNKKDKSSKNNNKKDKSEENLMIKIKIKI